MGADPRENLDRGGRRGLHRLTGTSQGQVTPNALQQVHDYWFACAWRIALAMRLGTSFKEVTSDIMQQDVTAFQEAVPPPAAHKTVGGEGQTPQRLHRPGRHAP